MKSKTLIFFISTFSFLSSCSDTELSFDPEGVFSQGINNGLVDNATLNQASGVVASRINNNLLWHHNDGTASDKQVLFVTNYQGKSVKQFELKKYFNRDWEDIAIVGDKNNATIYIGDIGDNSHVYPLKYIYKFQEPKIEGISSERVLIDKIDKISFQYSDGVKYDSECLMVDQLSKDIYIITKSDTKNQSDKSYLFKIKYPQSTAHINTAERILEIPFMSVTGGDISADNSEILIRTYIQVFYTKLRLNESIKDSFRRSFKSLPYLFEPQGEAICFESGTNPSYFTTSDSKVDMRKSPDLFFYKRN